MFNFHDMPSPAPIEEEHDEQQQLTPTAELLRAHYKLLHLPFSQISLMAAHGQLPKRLIDCCVPCCTSCLFGKATNTPWGRSKASRDLSKFRLPRSQDSACRWISWNRQRPVSLLSSRGHQPTLWRYRAATVFVDHFSQLSFVHLQQTLSSEDTLLAKQAFERFCSTHGVKVIHYHNDNALPITTF